MASQKELIAVVAESMGVAIETVTVVDRYLAEAGLRTRALRGRGVTPMGYGDAANMIIATAWDANPASAVHLVEAYRALPVVRVKETALVDKHFLGQTFGKALANMLEAVPADRAAFSSSDGAEGHMSATVFMHGPTEWAEIVLVKDGKAHTFQYGGISDGSTDLQRTVRFSQITLGFVGSAVADGFDK